MCGTVKRHFIKTSECPVHPFISSKFWRLYLELNVISPIKYHASSNYDHEEYDVNN
jgi:hypothetical protein